MTLIADRNIYIHKFGRLDAITTDPKTLWGEGSGLKTYSDTPFALRMKSNQAGDTGQLIEVTGIRVISGVWTYATETATTNGTSAVKFDSEDWVRIFRARNLADFGSEMAGTLNFYRNTTEADVEVRILAGYDQTTFAGMTIPDNYKGELRHWGASSTNEKSIIRLYARDQGKVWRLQGELDAVNYTSKKYTWGVEYAAREDIEVRAILESGNGGACSTDFDIQLIRSKAA